MGKNQLIYLSIMMSLICSSCMMSKNVEIARIKIKDHQTVAIMPPVVTFENGGNLTATELDYMCLEYSLDIQERLHARFIKKQSKQKPALKVQNIQKTNRLLKKIGYFENPQVSTEKLFEMLQVDGIIFSNVFLYTFNKRSSCFRFQIPWMQKEMIMYLEIWDKYEKYPIFQYESVLRESHGSSYRDNLMIRDHVRIAVNSLPYFKKQFIK